MQSNEATKEQQQQGQKINDIKPVLLSKTELQWLRNDIKVSKSFEYKIKSSIKLKIQTLTKLELPLLIKNNFLATYDLERVDDSLGRDLESGASNDTALVRQRSWVQIPAKASLFCKKEAELRFFPVIPLLQLVVTALQLDVTAVSWEIKPFSISNGSSISWRIRIFFLISLFIFRS
jgi:hypothetical protein